MRPMDIFGFNPVWPHTRSDMKIIMAIGFKRGVKRSEDVIKRSEAHKIIATDTRILSLFKKTFPFLKKSISSISPS
jgi:hypothetical protein